MGCFLAGGPLAFVGWDLLARCMSPGLHRFHMMSGLYQACMFAYQRIFIFFPMAWTLWGVVQTSAIPRLAKFCLYLGGINMTCFNLLCMCMIVGGWLEKFVLKPAKKEAESPIVARQQNSPYTPPTILTSPTSRGRLLKHKLKYKY